MIFVIESGPGADLLVQTSRTYSCKRDAGRGREASMLLAGLLVVVERFGQETGKVGQETGKEGQVMARGTVKWFNVKKGSGSSLLTMAVGMSSCTIRVLPGRDTSLSKRGQFVEFEIGDGAKGPQAVDVRAL